jgi:hypothetical protein
MFGKGGESGQSFRRSEGLEADDFCASFRLYVLS